MIRHALRGLLIASILLVLCLAAVFALAQTAPGKRFIAAQLSSMLSTPESTIKIESLHGWIPIDLKIGRLQLADGKGVWLEADGIAADWSPSALMSGRLQIDLLGADRLHLTRVPESSEDEIDEDDKEPFKLPELPTSLTAITIAQLAIPEIVLDAPVLGEAASFELDGSLTASDDGRHVDLTFDVQRIDQATAFLTLTSGLSLDPLTLEVDLDAGETGNLMAQMTGQADAGDLDIALTGNGPLENWVGELHLEADGLGKAEAEIGLALLDQPSFIIDAKAEPAAEWLPADLGLLLANGLDLSLKATQTQAQVIDVEQLRLRADQMDFGGAGLIDFDQGDLQFDATLNAPDLQPLSTIAKAPLEGGIDLALKIEGTLQQPNGILALNGDGLRSDGIEIGKLANTVDWATNGSFAEETFTIQLGMKGAADGLFIPGTPLPDENVTWQTTLHWPLQGEVTLRDARIETAGATFEGKGTLDPNTLVSDLDLQFRAPALSNLLAKFDVPIDGDALIDAAVTTTSGAKTVHVDLKAIVDQLENLPDGAKELVGRKLDLETIVSLKDQRHLEISDLRLDGAEATLKASLALDLKSDDLSGDVEATLPRLAALAGVIEQPIAGAVELGAKVGGHLSEPVAELTVSSDQVEIGEETIEAIALTWNGATLATEPEGALTLDLTARSLPLKLALNYQLADRLLNLSDVQLTAPETTLGGKVAVNLDNTLLDGTLGGSIDDLQALQPLLDQKINGSLELEAVLSQDQTSQKVNLDLALQDLGGDFGEVDRLDIKAAIDDLLGKASISATSDLREFRQGDVTIASLIVKADGDQEDLAINVDLTGKAIEPITLTARSNLSLADKVTVELNQLDGAFAGEAMSLGRSLLVEQEGGRFKFANLDLRIGQASLKGDVDIGPSLVSGNIDLHDLSLAWLEPFGGPALTGLAKANVDLSGTPGNPVINAEFDANDIDTKGITDTNLPAADLAIRAAFQDGKLISRLTASGLTKTPITASATLPAALTLSPFAFDMPENGPLEGKVNAEIQLAHIGDLLALDQQIITGLLSTDLTLGGTINAPLIEGPIELQNGLYENITSGTALRDLTLQADASKERITIKQLTASVGEEGKTEASGWIELNPDDNFPFSLAIDLQEAELLATDDMEAILSGDIALLGDLEKAVIEGDVLVNQAEIWLPDSTGPSLPDIDIEEIGGNIINSVKKKKESEPAFDPVINMKVDLPNKVYVRGRGLESEWFGNLNVTGPTSAPQVTGALEIKTGYFDFIEKRFEIDEGTVDFSGASPPDPSLAIEASTTEDDFKAIIKVTGSATNPKLLLESEPVLPEDEVLARLLFDRELSEIGVIEAGKLALALNKLRSGGGGGFDAFGEIRDAFNIDTLDVVSDETGDSKVKAGKYLSEDVYFELERGAADESGRARVEIEIHPNVSIEADTGEDANGGVGLKWRFNY